MWITKKKCIESWVLGIGYCVVRIARLRTTQYALLTTILCTTGCNKPLPVLENFNSEEWIKDINGCGNKRTSMAEALYQQQHKIVGMESEDVVALLGQPEKTNYRGRSAFFYYYFIESGKQCDETQNKKGDMLVVEAEALGRVRKLRIENGF